VSLWESIFSRLRRRSQTPEPVHDLRDLRGGWRRDLAKDLTHGLRLLRRNPGFAAVAILSLAIGIAANSAIFSVVNSMLLRPRAVSNPDELVELFVGDRRQPYQSCSYPSYLDFRQRNEVFSGLAAYGIRQFTFGDATQVEYVWGEAVSGNYFDVLGILPHQGQMFHGGDAPASERDAVVVLGHRLWQRRFGSDPKVIGQPVSINGQRLTVIGVAPPQYTGMIRGLSIEIWVPATVLPALEPSRGERIISSRGNKWLILVGRLKPGATLDQAQARFDVLSREMQAAYPREWADRNESTGAIREHFVTVISERDTRIHPSMEIGTYAVVGLVVAVVNLLILIACINLAGMLLARAVLRRREIAVRLAIGAGRFRIVRQLVTESLLLSLIAGAVGLALGAWWLKLLLANMPAFPEGVRVAFDIHLDWRVVAYTFGFATLTGIVFGLAPALLSSKTEVSAVLKDDSIAFSGGYRRSRVRAALVVAQVAVSLLLLIGGGLVLRSLEKIRPTSLGFSSDNVLVAFLTQDEVKYDRTRSQMFYRQLSERVSALPGVQSVSFIDGMPGGFMSRTRRGTEIEGYTAAPGESLAIDAAHVGPYYFTNLKVPIVQGRDIDDRDRDGAPCVAVVNETFVSRYLPGGSALGKRIAKYDPPPMPERRMCAIVGVVRDDPWQSLQKELRPFYWLAAQQSHRRRMTLLVSTQGNPASQIAPVRAAVQELDPHMPVTEIQTLEGYFSTTSYPFRLLGVVMGACGAAALLLAAIGVYGIVSYSVAQRTREVGIRMALGALRREILQMVVGQGMSLVSWGLVLGLLLSFGLTRILTSSLFGTELLFGVDATDSLTFAGLTIFLALVALAACSIPALRATRVDPMTALRYE
jgi:predicted permease